MPVRWNTPQPAGTPAPSPYNAPEEPSTLRRLLAGGLRIGSGALASLPALEPGVGSLVGAGIAGAGESGAEWIEGREQNPYRIGTEAALGAMPLGWFLKAGRPMESALKSGALAAFGEGGRELSEGNGLSPSAMTTSGIIGGVTGGLLGRMGMKKAPDVGSDAVQTSGAVPSAGGVGKSGQPKGKWTPPTGGPRTIRVPSSVGEPQWKAPGFEMDDSQLDDALRGFGTPMTTEEHAANLAGLDPTGGARVPYTEGGAVPFGSAAKSAAAEAKTSKEAFDAEIRAAAMREREEAAAAAAQAKADKEAAARAAIDEARTPGVEPTIGAVSERISAPTETGREGFTRTWKPEAEDDGMLDDLFPEGGGGAPKAQTPQQQVAAHKKMLFEQALAKGMDPVAAMKFANKGVPFTDAGEVGAAASLSGDSYAELDRWLSRPESPESPSWDAASPSPATPKPPPVRPPTVPQTPKAAAPPASPNVASVPFMITRKMEADLRARGFSPEEISRMTPAEAGEILASPAVAPTPEPPLGDVVDNPPTPGGYKIGDPLEITYPADHAAAPFQTEAPSGTPPPGQGSALGRFFTAPEDPVDAAGQRYRDIKEAIAGGAGGPEMARMRGVAGRNVQQEAKAAGLPTGRAALDPHMPKFPPLEAPPEAPPAAPVQPGWAEQQSAELDKLLKAQGEGNVGNIDGAPPVPPKKPGGTPIGIGLGGAQDIADLIERHPQFATRLGLAAGGALVGGMANPTGNTALSAALGAAAGAAIPSLPQFLKGIGTPDHIIEDLPERLSTPEGVHTTVGEIARALPGIQRFSLLTSVTGLPANVIAGPWGSAMMFGLEMGLSGDSRGFELVKRIVNPVEFIKTINNSFPQALENIAGGELGRAETSPLSKLFGPKTQQVMQLPGTWMNAGDVAARQYIMEAGFTLEEAQRATLTNNPELPAFHTVAELGKNSPLMQFLFPFKRTVANIGEQGALATPGLGWFLNRAKEKAGGTADPLKQQLVQQLLMTPAVAGGSYELGKNVDPESGRILGKYVSNAGGKYSLAAGAGFAAGQASRAGRDPATTGIANVVNNAVPLPSMQPLTDLLRLFQGGGVPRSLVPAALREAFGAGAPTAATPRIPTRFTAGR